MTFPRTATLTVRAKDPDRPVPMARIRRHIDRRTGRDTNAIYHETPVQVPNNRYYRRRCVVGELELVEAAGADLGPSPTSSGGSDPKPMRLTTRVQAAASADPTEAEGPPASDPGRSEE